MAPMLVAYLEEGDRQMILLAIAELALSRPGFDNALGDIADQLKGRDMFDRFKYLNADRVRASHDPLGDSRGFRKCILCLNERCVLEDIP